MYIYIYIYIHLHLHINVYVYIRAYVYIILSVYGFTDTLPLDTQSTVQLRKAVHSLMVAGNDETYIKRYLYMYVYVVVSIYRYICSGIFASLYCLFLPHSSFARLCTR